MASISVCMIVKNEERFLPASLASLAELAPEEIVVVDTGSTDRTIEIARSFGAKVVEWAWRDDYAAARNVSIDHATSDWCLIFDADYRLVPGAARAIREFIGSAPNIAARLPTHDAMDPDDAIEDVISGRRRLSTPNPHILLLRRDAAPYFRGAVHESALEWLRERGRERDSFVTVDADIVHLGASPQVDAHLGKSARYKRILLDRVAANARDLGAYFYLIRDAVTTGDTDEAERFLRIVHALQGPFEDDELATMTFIARQEAILGSRRGDARAIHAAIDRLPPKWRDCAELLFLRGLALELQEQHIQALAFYHRDLAHSWWRYDQSSSYFSARAWETWMRIGSCYATLGEVQLAHAAYEKAVVLGGAMVERSVPELRQALEASKNLAGLRTSEVGRSTKERTERVSWLAMPSSPQAAGWINPFADGARLPPSDAE